MTVAERLGSMALWQAQHLIQQPCKLLKHIDTTYYPNTCCMNCSFRWISSNFQFWFQAIEPNSVRFATQRGMAPLRFHRGVGFHRVPMDPLPPSQKVWLGPPGAYFNTLQSPSQKIYMWIHRGSTANKQIQTHPGHSRTLTLQCPGRAQALHHWPVDSSFVLDEVPLAKGAPHLSLQNRLWTTQLQLSRLALRKGACVSEESGDTYTPPSSAVHLAMFTCSGTVTCSKESPFSWALFSGLMWALFLAYDFRYSLSKSFKPCPWRPSWVLTSLRPGHMCWKRKSSIMVAEQVFTSATNAQACLCNKSEMVDNCTSHQRKQNLQIITLILRAYWQVTSLCALLTTLMWPMLVPCASSVLHFCTLH